MVMQDGISPEIRAALAAAERRGAKGGGRISEGRSGDRPRDAGLRVQVGRRSWPVLRIWESGLALPAEAAGSLRGRVDVYDGSRHLFHCLIVAHGSGTGLESDSLICEFKQATAPSACPPLDYARDPDPTPG